MTVVTEALKDEWISAVATRNANGFLREGSIRIYGSKEGYGTPPGIEAYPHQGLDIEVAPYDYPWLDSARGRAWVTRDGWGACIPAGNLKHPGFTPLGTSIATLLREGHDILSAPCGYCSVNLASCKCTKGSDSE